jgi:endopeptidase Clp ATP-binding regulatory subunit ClpX
VKQHLDRFVIRQDDAKRVLATAVCDHYNHVRLYEQDPQAHKHYVKQNVLMLGPTGVGKTYLIKCLAELIGVPFVKADATKFSETGYVGGDVEDIIKDLARKADDDLELAKYGMVYIDEIDKLASPPHAMGRDVSGAGVQRGLLKLMEETDVPLRASHDIQSQIQAMMEYQQKGKLTKPVMNTRHVLFIVSGAFGSLAPIVDRRLRSANIGFAAQKTESVPASQLFRKSRTDDFVQFGFEPEFVGRLPVRVVCDPLSEDDLYTILSESEGSVIRQYQASFLAYGIQLDVRESGMREIAKQAALEETGARGLITVCERIFRDFKYELPSGHVKRFTLDAQLARDPAGVLRGLLEEDRHEASQKLAAEIVQFEKNFDAKNALAIEFDAAAREALAGKILDSGGEAAVVLEKMFGNYGYGLGLIQKKKPRGKFILTAEAVRDPDHVLERWIKESYEG